MFEGKPYETPIDELLPEIDRDVQAEDAHLLDEQVSRLTPNTHQSRLGIQETNSTTPIRRLKWRAGDNNIEAMFD